MQHPRISADDVTRDVERISKQALDDLGRVDLKLHEGGYRRWSTIVANLRTKLEAAYVEAVDQLMEER
jgi:hypothetical protein